ncbi:MAG: hypoxanthine phosphoribosyltransferase [Clostridia bacterium]|nr:hypoxanthine phosphoribosyltransferase [Clostridia bacterium]
MDENIEEILIDEQMLAKRVNELAKEISAAYQTLDIDELVVIGVLRGSVIFMSDLIRRLILPVTIDFLAISSYTKGTRTSGTVRILKDIAESITDKHVLVIEDIVDTGLTLQCLLDLLGARRPKSLKICTLLDKPTRRLVDLEADYVGFQIPDKFVVGYGLDYEGHYRQVPYIGVLKPEAYQ